MKLLKQGYSVQKIAMLLDLSRKTIHKWRNRYQQLGPVGLKDLSTRPRHSPKSLGFGIRRKVLQVRNKGLGPANIALRVGISTSSAYRILCQENRQYLKPKIIQPTIRYEKTYPGELLHLDFKKLVPLSRKMPREYQFAILDDFSREVFSRIYPDSSSKAATDFFVQALRYFPYPLSAVLTDNAFCFTMRYACHSERQTLFSKTLETLGIRHKLIKPHHPQTNGKVERFFRTVEQECYQIICFQNSQHRVFALNRFIRYYNHRRPHLALGGLTPIQRRDEYLKSKVLPMS
jgi:transposase InsO family protein